MEREDTNDFHDDLSDYVFNSDQLIIMEREDVNDIDDPSDYVINSESEGYSLGELFVSYFAGSLPIFGLAEKHQRTADSGEVFERVLLRYFEPDQFGFGTFVITKSVGERMKSWSYVPLYEFSEGICEQKTPVLKRDIFDKVKIIPGSTETADELPLYLAPLLKMASRDLLWFLDFAESVDYCLTPMTVTVCEVMMVESSTFRDLEKRFEYLESEELDECLKNLDSLICELQNCQNNLIIHFQYLFQARFTLRELYYERNMRLSSGAVIKLCRLRDFCNYALTLYMNNVLETMEVLNSLLFTSKKLDSFLYPPDLISA